MKFFRLLIAAALLLSFSTGALAQDAAAPAAGGEKKSVEERKDKIDKMQAKKEEQFKKRIATVTEMITKIEFAISENKINEKQKAKMLENMKKRLDNSQMLLDEMKETIKMLETNLKVAEETRDKAKGVYEKLSSYTPPVKEAAGDKK
jgi:chromosome segregation ATPase